ncbi:glycine/betaine ABC transporter substrate-binding protein [Streptomyces sp. V2]|uniref:ABC transporter substrate-binding protein n=1 Tax=Streptomyces TaxID=1883 RepID=UPI0006EB5251|nr:MULTISPECIES: ABC transporter substrate-binding protein [Streptomyces]PWG14477.1 glycine/betaine ABC transporter substrate-binding protein [Streptomyces sp. V2]
MAGRTGRWRSRAAGTAVLGLTLTACVGAKVGEVSAGAGGSGSCGTFNLAVSPWVGYAADAAVVSYLAEEELGCKVVQKDLKAEIGWQGFETGEVDAILENWGHPDLKKKYITRQKTAVSLGSAGNKGIIGWHVPPWIAEQHPDITDWKNLDKYAANFRTSESGSGGQLLDGDPSYQTNDEALVKNLKLDFTVVYAGSETALIQAFRDAQKNRKWVIGYFYEPSWFMSEVPLVKVALPKHTEGCDADPAKVACDYPAFDLDKIVSTRFAASGSPAYDLVKNFRWTNDDQNTVAKYIALDKMTPRAAAEKWIAANPAKVKAWLAG